MELLSRAHPESPKAPYHWVLHALDVAALATGAVLAFLLSPSRLPDAFPGHTPAFVVAIVVSGWWLLKARSLYLARIADVRSIELERLFRALAVLGLVWALLELASTDDVAIVRIMIGVGLQAAMLVGVRGLFRAWLRAQRAEGRHVQPIVVVGTNDHARYLHTLLSTHPELGFRPVGVVGDRNEAVRHGIGGAWLGPETLTPELVRSGRITGLVIAAGALPPAQLEGIVREASAAGAHVHLSPGIRGVGHQRMRAVHLAYEPLYQVEPMRLQRHQRVVKRTIDVAIASVALLVTSPVLGVAALWVKLHDRGPVLFRQERVGLEGRPFRMLKLRTMRVNAEAELEALAAANLRQGPLFKMARDPRVTRPGRLLRALSVDELPQLFNVLAGDMSLVGPRPALPHEIERFDRRLLGRLSVLPGITGLWQVEARDHPSFEAYERLDLFYVENWSIFLDLCILLSTVESELARVLRSLRRRTVEDVIDLRDRAGQPALPEPPLALHPDVLTATD